MKVWLTFDDGPSEHTPELLAILQRFNIAATFFVVGSAVAARPDIVSDAFRRGHRIGNHTFNHVRLPGCSSAEIEREIRGTAELIRPFIAAGSRLLFRPPYGDFNDTVERIVWRLGYQMVLWHVDPRDWSELYQPTAWVAFGLWQIGRHRDRAIVLNHDTLRTTVENVAPFIEGILRMGGEFRSPYEIYKGEA